MPASPAPDVGSQSPGSLVIGLSPSTMTLWSDDISTVAIVVAAAVAWLVYHVAQALHRLYLSPVAKFPGPRLAAVSFWYEFYYDVIQGGQYTFKIKELHEKYGPIIRINPHELHVATPSFYDKVFAGPGKRRNRWDWVTAQFGIPESMFGALDHEVHRKRRAAINHFFSKRAVNNLQPIIDERLDTLLARFQEFQTSHETMILDYAFSAFTNDIAQEYAFARSDHRLEQHDFEPTFHKAAIAGTTSGALIKQYPWILPVMTSMPDAVMIWLDPNMASYFELQRNIRNQIQEMKSGKRDDSKDADHRTIFYEILNSDLPAREKSHARLAQDGQISVVGGTITTSWTLCVAAYFLLSQPDTLRKLKEELRQAVQGPTTPLTLATLEKLPYLSGCIQESLRLSYGASTRLARIAPDETLVFNDGTKDWLIPPGTPVGLTSYIIHHDESVFPDSFKFIPERWVENPRLDKYMVSFTKGSRICLGINLAYAELYLVLARLFRAYGSTEVRGEDDVGYLELFETDVNDVKLSRDCYLPLPRVGSEGVRIRVRK